MNYVEKKRVALTFDDGPNDTVNSFAQIQFYT